MLGFIKRFSKNAIEESKELDGIKEKSDMGQEEPIRAIIDGLLYDTSKARKIGTFYDWGFGSMDLYVTKNNRFFSAQKNGRFKISLISESEAKKILSQYPDKYQETFGKVEEA